MAAATRSACGWWTGPLERTLPIAEGLRACTNTIERPTFVFHDADGSQRVSNEGVGTLAGDSISAASLRLLAVAPPLRPEDLGDEAFKLAHGLRYAYVSGAMANGIGSVEIVEAMGRAGMVGFFGSAGLPLERVANAVDRLTTSMGNLPFGINLIHSPNEPDLEAEIVRLYLERGVRLVEASAFLDLTLPVVRFRLAGIHQGPDGSIQTPNRVIAKVSRVEVASKFLSPAPERFVNALVAEGFLTEAQAQLARRVPMAEDLSAEADSGGHTDNRPAITLLPTLIALRDRLQEEHRYHRVPRIGLGGGIATPASVAAAFAMGAAYVLTGSINQACVESGSSDLVRQMLAEAEQADCIMAPAADMFEMGVKVQVLKRGTMFAMRGAKLYELYRNYDSLDAIPTKERETIERTMFRASLDEIWSQTRAFFATRDPRQIERAEKDRKHQMALVFRWYLGLSSRWANAGEADRRLDFQVWCGPAMGAFNEWTKGTNLEKPEERRVATVARNLLFGACVLQRLECLRSQGITIPPGQSRVPPLAREELEARFA